MADKTPYAIEMYGTYSDKTVKLISGIIEGEVNGLPTATIEFVSADRKLELSGFVGNEIGFKIVGADEKTQRFYGTCISAEYKGSPSGDGHYFAEIRPRLWFLTRSRNNRIFQMMKTTEIVQSVLGDYGFSGDLELSQTAEEEARQYCVQYRETDLDFIKRLCEEDGIYFYYLFKEDGVKLILTDSASTHQTIAGDDKIPFRDDEAEQQLAHVYKWESQENVTSGKVTLDDYNFEKPKADLKSAASIEKGTHTHKGYEIYKYPGGYRETSKGDKFATTLMEAAAAQHKKWIGEGNAHNLWVGQVFELIDHPRHTTHDNSVFLVTKAKQFFRLETDTAKKTRSLLEDSVDFGLSGYEHTRLQFEAVLKSDSFRMPFVTIKPEIAGIHTAVVTGPAGEEIHVDQYGRIKVQFHWDRDGKNDDKTTCWVRTMMPWVGKGWGMVSLPRIGQEVVIQFEEGDPDRPMCVGMLYNADNMPPYPLPEEATRSGVKTNSSKGGNGYNELMFEDKKGDELIRLDAEKDFSQTVQNSAHTRVGYKHGKNTRAAAVKNPATGNSDMAESMILEVKKDLVEIMETGDHYFEVKDGQQDIKIKKDKTEEVEGKFTETVTDDVTKKVKQGNYKETIEAGNVDRETSMGNETNKIGMGNFTLNVDMGKIEIEAMQKIKLTCGASSIEMSPSEIKITAPMVSIEGQMTFEAKGGISSTIKGGALVVVQGAIVKIN